MRISSCLGLVQCVCQFRCGCFVAVHQHPNLALLGAQHDGLLAQSAHHVERALGLAAQRQLLDVVGDPALDDLA